MKKIMGVLFAIFMFYSTYSAAQANCGRRIQDEILGYNGIQMAADSAYRSESDAKRAEAILSFAAECEEYLSKDQSMRSYLSSSLPAIQAHLAKWKADEPARKLKAEKERAAKLAAEKAETERLNAEAEKAKKEADAEVALQAQRAAQEKTRQEIERTKEIKRQAQAKAQQAVLAQQKKIEGAKTVTAKPTVTATNTANSAKAIVQLDEYLFPAKKMNVVLKGNGLPSWSLAYNPVVSGKQTISLTEYSPVNEGEKFGRSMTNELDRKQDGIYLVSVTTLSAPRFSKSTETPNKKMCGKTVSVGSLVSLFNPSPADFTVESVKEKAELRYRAGKDEATAATSPVKTLVLNDCIRASMKMAEASITFMQVYCRGYGLVRTSMIMPNSLQTASVYYILE